MNLDAKAEKLHMQKKIETYVKQTLFKRLKFFYLDVMLYDTRKNSMCQKVCDFLNMADSGRMTCWSTYSPCVENAIRYTRNDAVQAMKSAFLKGMFLLIKRCIIDKKIL